MPKRGMRAIAEAEVARREQQAPAACWLCARPLGRRVEWHHPVPKARGGRTTVPVHPICHRSLHATLTNADLARIGEDVERLRADPRIVRFLAWVADKPADFHAPTRRGGDFGPDGGGKTARRALRG